MYSLVVYIPQGHVEEVKAGLFEAGAGRFNNYDCCCFEVKGVGQFRPSDEARPFIGQLGKVEKVEEVRVEFLVKKEEAKSVLEKLLEVHPYETPAFFLIPSVHEEVINGTI